MERRRYTSIPTDDLEYSKGWDGLRSMTRVQTETWINNETIHETRYYISSLPADAKQVGRAIRAHWGIENSLHWSLDTCFREDACQTKTGHAAENLAMLRHVAMNLLKSNTTKASLKKKRKRASIDDRFLEALLFDGN